MTQILLDLDEETYERLQSLSEMFDSSPTALSENIINFTLDNTQEEWREYHIETETQPAEKGFFDPSKDMYEGTRPTSVEDLPDGSTQEDVEVAQDVQPEKSFDELLDDIDSLGE